MNEKNDDIYIYGDIQIKANKWGANYYLKSSYPVRHGQYSQIETPAYIFQFNLNGEIKLIQDKINAPLYPGEWFKRSMANDWTFYASPGYGATYHFMGEYYLPCFSYPTNAVFDDYIFNNERLEQALNAFKELIDRLKRLSTKGMPVEIESFLKSVTENNLDRLKHKGEDFHSILNSRISVLPPDTRHTDYDVIPIILSDGCLYNCGFCAVKSGQEFQVRSQQDILKQIKGLKTFYGDDLPNYNSLFLGMHDALNVEKELIEYTIETAVETFDIEHSKMLYPKLFLFGSVDSLLDADESLFETLNKMPFYTFINIGMESPDQETLDKLRKPLSADKVKKSFEKMLDINLAFDYVEITANFVIGSDLPDGHFSSIAELTKKEYLESHNKDLIMAITSMAAPKMHENYVKKGNIYLSPLIGDKSLKKMLKRFDELKKSGYLSMFMYLIQRL